MVKAMGGSTAMRHSALSNVVKRVPPVDHRLSEEQTETI